MQRNINDMDMQEQAYVKRQVLAYRCRQASKTGMTKRLCEYGFERKQVDKFVDLIESTVNI